MAHLLALLFCAATGFAIAGAVASFYQLVTAKAPDFLVAARGPVGNIAAVLLTMVGGPFILTGRVLEGLRTRRLTAFPAACGLLAAGMWSAIAGTFFLGLLVTA